MPPTQTTAPRVCRASASAVIGRLPWRALLLLDAGLAAGFSFVAEISTEKRRLGAIKTLAKKQLPEEEFARIAFVSPEELFELLPTLEVPRPDKETTVRGYRVRVRLQPGQKAEAEERRGAMLRLSLWPQGPVDEALAVVDFHGRWLEWRSVI